jgi:UDP-N-acetylmuramoylalanine--D-glutamate ligase
MAEQLGAPRAAILEALARFRGLPHRLQLLATIDGRDFYNDSKATSPAAAEAALAALQGPLWWLGGGHAKGADFQALARNVTKRARGAAVFGTSRDALAAALHAADNRFPIAIVERLEEAATWCWRQSAPGDAILLSPAAASYDQFLDYADRGRAFGEFVQQLRSAQHR